MVKRESFPFTSLVRVESQPLLRDASTISSNTSALMTPSWVLGKPFSCLSCGMCFPSFGTESMTDVVTSLPAMTLSNYSLLLAPIVVNQLSAATTTM